MLPTSSITDERSTTAPLHPSERVFYISGALTDPVCCFGAAKLEAAICHQRPASEHVDSLEQRENSAGENRETSLP